MVVREVVSLAIMNWVVLGLVCFVSLFSGFEAQSQSCHPDDLSALKEFAGNLINGSIIKAWSSELDCCSWEGVVCGGRGRVAELNVSRKGLKGNISESLGGLVELVVLDLSHNELDGGLPNGLSNLELLQNLDVSHNILSGPVWGALARLTAIRSLNLSSNLFTGNLSGIGDFRNLAEFVISSNSFSGVLDSRLCRVSSDIRVLNLSMNNFTGGLEGLDSCSASLRRLNLDENSFSGPFPDFIYSMAYLEELSISTNSLSGSLRPELSKLSNLKSLVLAENMLSGYIPDVFGNLSSLEQFVAHTNFLTGPLPASLAQCSNLKVLDLRNNSLHGLIDLNFTGLPNLSTLDLGTNHFHGLLPDNLSASRSLKILSFAKNSLTGEIPKSYANLKSLSFLSLSNNSLEGLSSAISVLQNCRNLSTLILTRNFHGEEIPANLSGGFESLMVFALGNCGLNGQIPSWLLNCRKLEVLDLSWNHLNGSIPTWIGKMENLFYLDFSNNSLSGEIPNSITELKGLITYKSCSSNSTSGLPLYVKRNQSSSGLQYNQASSFPPSIFLSNNRLNGTIPAEIGQLKEAHVLDFSRNNITGTIPASFSAIRSLENLDLSFNDLHGSIPPSFDKLTFLSKFSVAYNHLQGTIPTGGQFFSFPTSSFDGNPGLCGNPLSSCAVNNVGGMIPPASSGSKKRFARGSIIGVTISIAVGIMILLGIVLLKLSRRESRNSVEDMEDDVSRQPRSSEAFGPSKLVLFQNSECKDLTVSDILKSTNNFSQSNIVGCGGFGLVYKADLPGNKRAAIKRLSGDCGQMEREFQAEVEALSQAQHKNLVSLQGYCRHGSDRLLIYSYMENGSLDYWLHERIDETSSLGWETRLNIARGAAHGLAYLHREPNIVHRDIKTSNILLDDRFEAHLADFGLSRLLHPYDTHVTTDLVGTLGYIPPEYGQTLTATFRGDVYSFGVVLLELLTGRRPVEVCKGKNCRDLVSWVFQMKSEKREKEIFEASIWDDEYEKGLLEVLGIACKCIDQEPRRRPSIDQVVSWLDAVETGKATVGNKI